MSLSSSVYSDESHWIDLLSIDSSLQKTSHSSNLEQDDSALLPGKFLEEPHTRPVELQAIQRYSSSHINTSARMLSGGPAAPLMPLRERDVKALSDFFDPMNMAEVEADILQNLLWLWPEPCWEDDPYEFLREYL
ncbi:MAG: hypothetical protein LRZ84_25180 [Desertifilum sp.]|nr:hypothetical protein [Oscillatoria laete-virens]MCD8489938.1 hypothetical protein [Desertifilum sp.]MDI9641802.1 hypothetical protein [Geitlerinema splendidum]MDL5052401.1 hypothetical protein [Oscillatoria laete-virens NRMC-F 0139]